MSESECHSYTREQFLEEFVHPDDRPVLDAERTERTARLRAAGLAQMRQSEGMTQAEVAAVMGVTQQRVSAIEAGQVAELTTLAEYVRALGGELKVIADFGETIRRVA